MLLAELRVGQVEEVTVVVVEVWEGGAYLVGDSSASLRLVALKAARVLNAFEIVTLDVELQRGSLRLIREKEAPTENIIAIESCGIVVFARNTGRFLAVRDYHTKPFMDVQFKFKAAFDQRTPGLPVDDMIKNISQWSNDELSWVLEWKLQKIWPYLTAEKIAQWTPVMRALDPEIKQVYRASKAELLARKQANGTLDVVNSSWGFPKGGPRVVRSRIESPIEAATRELREEVGLSVAPGDLVRHFDLPRVHGKTFDRWFLLELPEEAPIRPPPGAWDVACVEWVAMDAFPPSLERFRDSLVAFVPAPPADAEQVAFVTAPPADAEQVLEESGEGATAPRKQD